MDRKLEQAVEDWFLNSPSWPFVINVEKETDDFLRDGCEWSREEVLAAIARFAAANQS